MTAQQGNEPDAGQKRSGDIQARQTDDGSFELVMENAAASASSDSAGAGNTARPAAAGRSSSASGTRRLVVAVVVAVALVGAAAYLLSGDSESADDMPSETASATEAGFRPYVEEPGEQPAAAAPKVERRQTQTAQDEIAQEDFGQDEQEIPSDVEAEESEEWIVDGDSEVVVIEEEHPPEEEYVEEVEVEAEDETVSPEFTPSQIHGLRERVKLPIKAPQIDHIQPKLNRLRPQVGRTGRDEPISDEQLAEEQGEGDFADQEGYEDEIVDDETGSQYQGEEGGFDDYDQGY